MPRQQLPIDEALPRLLKALHDHPNVVLRAPTGAGKTTRVPIALIENYLFKSTSAGKGRILVLQPRRLAARAAARRMSAELGSKLGDRVGYQVRFDKRVSANTEIVVVTEGIFLRHLQRDPSLEGVAAVIFDEFHERNLDSDLALAMARRVQLELRPELKLIVMSATLATQELSEYLQAPIVESSGCSYPVEEHYLEQPMRLRYGTGGLEQHVVAGVERVLDLTDGDVLVFLPGVGEIRAARRQLESLATQRQFDLVELYGDLAADKQDAVLTRRSQRKVVLSTNVAESSVTIDGITAVVDSGLARTMQFEPGLGLDRLELTVISKASATQRAGRAGRQRPGVCLRLWSRHDHRGLAEFAGAEVQRVDLASAALQLACWGEHDLSAFPWFEAPPLAALDHATRLLELLGATEAGRPTELGKQIARLPVHPRLGCLLRQAAPPHARALCRVAALLSERDPFRGTSGAEHSSHYESDLLARLNAFDAFARDPRAASANVNLGAAHHLLRTSKQLERLTENSNTDSRAGDEAVLRALLHAFPDRVARRREGDATRAIMVGGRGLKLHASSRVREAEFFVAIDVDAGRRGAHSESQVRLASAIEVDWLDPRLLKEERLIEFDDNSERVHGKRCQRYLDLTLGSVAWSPGPEGRELVAEKLAAAAADSLERALNLDEPQLLSVQRRVALIERAYPDLEFPDFGRSAIVALLPQLCDGQRSFADLKRAPLLDSLLNRLSYEQRQRLDRDAPERLQVPSGSHIVLQYRDDAAPILPVRIQEMFGATATPRIAGGRVTVLLHLLAPNSRPQQVTDDLASFWATTYTEVRKELRRRYPKHAWPDDPESAQAERRPRRKR